MRGLRRRYDLPMTCADINRKVAAWKEIFGTEPRMMLDGTCTCADGELAVLHGNGIVSVGRQYVSVRAGGEVIRLKPEQGTWERGSLVLEGDE